MTHQTRNAIRILAIIVIIGGAYFLMKKRPAQPPASDTSATSTISTDTLTASNVQGAKSTTVTFGGDVPAPTGYATPLAYPLSLSAQEKTMIQAQYQVDVDQIKKDGDLNAWADLATLRKIVGDFKGAEEIWVYITKKYPTLSGPFSSLAALYADNLKNYPKAEANYLKAIAIDPRLPNVYVSLSTLYSNQYPKTNTAAEDILKQGIVANPTSYQLQLALARYYAGKGRIAEAKAQYAAAVENAKTQKQTAAAAQMEAEAAAL